MITGFTDRLKYVPYKMGEPKRLMALLLGVVGMAAGYSVEGKGKAAGLKMFLMSFGAVTLAAYFAGIFNPVTVYNRSRFNSATYSQGNTTGQFDPGRVGGSLGRNVGYYYGVDVGAEPAASMNDPIQPAIATSGGIPVPGVRFNPQGSEKSTGYLEGQTDTGGGSGKTGAYYYGASYQPGRPPFYYGAPNVVGCNPITGEGCNEVPPTEGSIYIRDVGEVEFNGGI